MGLNRRNQARLKLVILLIVMLPVIRVNAQRKQIDSLLNLISRQKEDTFKSYLLSELAYEYHLIWPDSTRIMAGQALKLAEKLGYEKGKADAMKHLAIGFYIGGEFEKGLEYNKRSLALYEKTGEKKGQGAVVNNIAIILQDRGRYEEALTYYKRSEALRMETGDSIGVAQTYNNIGNTYSDMGNYAEALHYLFRSLQMRERLRDRGTGYGYCNIARIYLLLGKFDEAIRYSRKGYDLFEAAGNADGIALAASILGGVYHERKQPVEALKYFNEAKKFYEQVQNYPGLVVAQGNAAEELTVLGQYDEARALYGQALKLSTEGGDREGMAISYTGLGLVELKKGNIPESIRLLNKGLETAMSIPTKLRISEASRHLAEAYKRAGDYKNANEALETFIRYKDSLFIEESAKKAEEIHYNFLLDKKQKEIALLEKDNKLRENEAERQRLISLVLIITLLFVLAGLFWLFRSRRKEQISKKLILAQKDEIEKQARKLEELNLLKDKTFSVLSHDLRSPVSSLIGVMTLLDEKMLSQEEFRTLQANFANQLKTLSQVLDNLLYWSKKHMAGEQMLNPALVPVAAIVEENIGLVAELAARKNIRIQTHVDDGVRVLADKEDVNIVIRNLLTNAIKFTGPAGEVTVTGRREGDFVRISVQDNGIGMDEQTLAGLLSDKPKQAAFGTHGERGTGIGLLICRERVEKNGGAMAVQSEKGKGSVFSFTLPAG